MPRFAANLSLMFADVPFLDRFHAARSHGFTAVEFMFPYAFDAAEIARAAAQAGVQVVLHNFPAGDWAAGDRGLAVDPDRHAEFGHSLELALDYARTLGVAQLHCLAGIAHAGADTAHPTYLGNLRRAARRLATHGIRLLIEPINQFDMPGYFLTSPQQADAVIRAAAEPNLFMQCDLYHWQRIQGELAATLRAHLPLIGHVQIADNPGRHEPGTGEINFRYLLRLLDELGYDGWVGCEYTPATDTAAGLGWRTAILDP